jgi:putative drug exporter of the RND superfamily
VREGGQYERIPELGFLGIPVEAMVGGSAHSGHVIFAAGGVMVAVFLTFALSGRMRPKQVGIILGFAVLRCSCG